MRIRLRFTKAGKVRFTSHRDVARMWERAIRRVGLPVSYSEGFSPRAKLHFGLALSTGHESIAEYLDVDLDGEASPDAAAVDTHALPGLLTPALPVGIDATAAAVIPAGTPSLQQAVTSCTWRINVTDVKPQEIATAIDRAMAAETLMLTRTRKGSEVTDDVRPYLLDLTEVVPTDSGTELSAHLATQPRWTTDQRTAVRSEQRFGRRTGHPNAPMDLARRRVAGASPARRDVSVARGEACVMRREHLDDRYRRRRSRRAANTGAAPNRR